MAKNVVTSDMLFNTMGGLKRIKRVFTKRDTNKMVKDGSDVKIVARRKIKNGLRMVFANGQSFDVVITATAK